MSAVHLGVKVDFDGSAVDKGLKKTSADATKSATRSAKDQEKIEKKTSAVIAKELNSRLAAERSTHKKVSKAVKQSAADIRKAKRAAYKAAGKEFHSYRTKVMRGIVHMRRGFRKLKASAAGSISSKLTAGMGALAAGASLAAAAQKVKESAERGKSIQDNAKAVGVTATEMQEWDYIFTRAGLETQDVSDAFATLADRSEDAMAGAQSMADDFALVGISIDDMKNKSPGELFEMFADGVAKSTDQNKALAAVVRTLGDDLGRKLLPMLKQGSGALSMMRGEAHELGVVMSEDTVAGLAKMDDELTKFKMKWDKEWGEVAVAAADAFTLGDKEVERGLDAMYGTLGAAWAAMTDADIDFGDAIEMARQKSHLDEDAAALAARNKIHAKSMLKAQQEQNDALRIEGKIRDNLAEKRKKAADTLTTSMEKLKAAEFAAMSPDEQRGVIEKRLELAKREELVAAAQHAVSGNRISAMLDPDKAIAGATKLADAKTKRLGIEAQLGGPTLGGGARVGQDQLARLGMFRGFQTEKSIIEDRQLTAMEQAAAQSKIIAGNTANLQAP